MKKQFKPKVYFRSGKRYHICIAEDLYYISFYGYGIVAANRSHAYAIGWIRYSSAPKFFLGKWIVQIVRPFKYERWK